MEFSCQTFAGTTRLPNCKRATQHYERNIRRRLLKAFWVHQNGATERNHVMDIAGDFSEITNFGVTEQTLTRY